MTTILAIDSSASGEGSVSKVLVQDALVALQQAHPGAKTIYHDLGRAPLPHITEANLAGIRGEPRSPDELATRALSDRLIGELKSADIILIGAPMYNFSMPTTLRAWFDHVLRAGETFSYSEAGPKGLVTGKRVIVIESRGGFYSDGPTKALDFQEPYLRQLLGFIGLTDVTFVHAEKIGFGPDAKAAAIAGALSSLSKLTQAA